MGEAVLQVAGGPGAGDSLAPSDLAELLSAFNDVTARLQETHERLRREVEALKRELGEANAQLERSRRLAALGEMAAGIAHEVRNPLSSIRLYARMLEQDLADRPGQRAIAAKIAAAVHGLDGVVGDVLTFARELRVRREAVPASDLLTRAVHACAAESPPGLRVDRPDRLRDPAVMVECDPGLAVGALVNVIRNACQAMAERAGERVLTLDARAEPRGGAWLSVADTGPGISPEVMERMFNPFFTTRAAGTGLGLAIVHRIVDAHAGRVAVRNRDTGGAMIELFFPSAGVARGDDAGPVAGATHQERVS